MRVAHLVHGLGLGGAQKIIGSIIREPHIEDLRYWVYSPTDGELRSELERAGAKVRIIPRRFPRFDRTWVRSLGRQMVQDRIELVHAHLFGDSLHGYLAARRSDRIPVVLTLHTTAQGLPTLQRIGYRWLIRRELNVIACSESVKFSLLQDSTGKEPEIQVIHNGIATSFPRLDESRIGETRSDLGLEPHDISVVALGRLEREKGYEYLIDAFSALCRDCTEQRVRLAFLGDGSLRNKLEDRVARKGLPEGSIRFCGFVDNASEILQAIDIVVFSSIVEGLSIALLESMRAGRCIVGSDIPGIREAVRSSLEAILVPKKNVELLQVGLGQAVRDSKLRRTLGERARGRFLANFSEDKMRRQYEELYVSIIERSRHGGGLRASGPAPPR